MSWLQNEEDKKLTKFGQKIEIPLRDIPSQL